MTSSRVPNPLPLSFECGDAESWPRTNFKFFKCNSIWTIEKFVNCSMKTGEKLFSPLFSSKTDKTEWCLYLCPAGNNEENKEYVSLYLRLKSMNEAEIRVRYRFCILNGKRKKVNVWEATEVATFLPKKIFQTASYGHDRFALKSSLLENDSEMLPDDNLTILCELSASTVASYNSTFDDDRSMIQKISWFQSDGKALQADTWGCTWTGKFSYVWTIRDFKSRKVETDKCKLIKSPVFSVRDNNETKWKLFFDPNDYSVEYKNQISLYLCPKISVKDDLELECALSIINSKGEKVEKFQPERKNFRWLTRLVIPQFVGKALLSGKESELLSDGNLRILCEISNVKNDRGFRQSIEAPTLEIPKSQSFDCLELLLETRKFYDVTFVVGDKELYAHRAILAVYSPVFSAMFEHEMKEQKLNRVMISDIDYEVLEETLRFVYTGRVRNLSGIARALLIAAEKYDLGELKAICERQLYSKLTIDNAADMLILADTYNAELLKSRTVDFLSDHATELVDNDSFKSMMIKYPQLFATTSFQLLANLKKK